ncbi:hypothetical protein FRB99_008885 [Tulasnella sp. 403]|nr:hypothetical protein FRB99_008885 [Tulasnella sp. 403]
MAAVVNYKATHYEHELQSALCRGAWAENQPAKTPKGVAIAWNELLRKYCKHCKGVEFAEIARHTRDVSLLLLSVSSSTAFTPTALDHDCEQPESALGTQPEYTLQDERIDEAKVPLAALKALSDKSSSPGVNLALGYAFFALNETRECLSVLSKVDYDAQAPIATTSSTVSTPSSVVGSLGASSGFSMLESALSRSGTLAGSVGVTDLSRKLDVEVGEGKVWSVVERVRGRCLQGLAHERLLDFPAALSSYDAGISLLDRLAVSRASPQGKAKLDLFSKYRPNPVTKSVWREEARKAIIDLRGILEITTTFPRAGEVNHRVLDLVDLCMAIWEKGGSDEIEAGWVIDTLWWATRLTFHSHRIMRHLSTLFLTQDNISTAKETFRLYVRLVQKARQTAGGDVSLQLKRRPTDDPPAHPSEISADVADEEGVAEENLRGTGVDADSDKTFVVHLAWGVAMLARAAKTYEDAKEADEMATLAEKICQTNSLSRNDALVARAVRAKGIASSLLALKGLQLIALSVTLSQSSFLDPDPRLRPIHQVAALEHLKRASTVDPESAGTFYHLAVVQAMSRDIDEAILSARTAVEKNPSEINAWHLLGLLLSAQGDWSGAQAVLELGLSHAEEADVDDEQVNGSATPTIDGLPVPQGGLVRDFAYGGSQDPAPPVEGLLSPTSLAGSMTPTPNTPIPNPPQPSAEPLLPTTLVLPAAHTLQSPEPDIPRRTNADRFEASLQLRMTQLALTELTEGADVATLKWPEIFAFFSEKAPSGMGQGHPLSNGNTYTGGGTTTGTNPSIRSFRRSNVPPAPLSGSITSSDGGHTGDGPRIGQLIPPSPGPGDRPGSIILDDENDDKPGSDGNQQTPGNLPKRILHKSQRQMHSIGKRVSSEARKLDDFVDGSMRGLNRKLHRTSSAPDFHALIAPSTNYQASSIHSRSKFRVKSLKLKAMASSLDVNEDEEPRPFSPPPPLPPPAVPTSRRPPRETRLLSDLWLTSAATFRRMGKLEQAKAAIQEAEVLDEENPGVWVQNTRLR